MSYANYASPYVDAYGTQTKTRVRELEAELAELKKVPRPRHHIPRMTEQAERLMEQAATLRQKADELETIAKELPGVFEYTLLRERIIELETKLRGRP